MIVEYTVRAKHTICVARDPFNPCYIAQTWSGWRRISFEQLCLITRVAHERSVTVLVDAELQKKLQEAGYE